MKYLFLVSDRMANTVVGGAIRGIIFFLLAMLVFWIIRKTGRKEESDDLKNDKS